MTRSLGFACSLNLEIVDSHKVVKAGVRQIHLSLIDDEEHMKKLAVLLGLSGAFLTAQADMTRTFDKDLVDDCNDDLGACMVFEYDTKSVEFAPASTAEAGNVLKFNYSIKGAYSGAGVGVVFDQSWAPVDASALTAVKLTLRSDADHEDLIYRVALKNSADTAYEALGQGGLGYINQLTAGSVSSVGKTITILPTKFTFPSWWSTGTDPINADAIAWVGGKTAPPMNAKRADVLKSLTAIQVSVHCDASVDCAFTGSLEIDDVTLVGVKAADGEDWVEGELVAGILPRSANVQGLRTAINGQSLLVGRGESSAATLDLIRLDGSKVASWAISGAKASVALPAGLEKGTYYAVVSSEGKRSSSSVSIVR